MDDGISIVGGGLSTTADTLRIGTFHILNRPEVLKRLKAELATVMPDPTESPPLKDLEALPYLSAVVSESLRIACGICTRLQRIAPDPLKYQDWVIPAGTPISMTIYLLHNRPQEFPEPDQFRPERWLESEGGNVAPNGERLDRYLIHFAKGSRSCVGMNLALAEIYLTLAYLFRRCDLELFETTREDVDIKHDYFTSFPRLDSKGVRVLVKNSV
jgi:cytochrome P450